MIRAFLLIAATLLGPAVLDADELPEQVTLATWNLEWFFDHYTGDNASDVAKEQSAPSEKEWEWKLTTTAAAVARLNATILCLQEVESRSTVYRLTKRLRDEHHIDYRVAFVEGSDVFTEQDVCVLAQSGLVEYGRKEQSREMFESKEFYNLSKHVFCHFKWTAGGETVRLTLLNVHLRALPNQTVIRTRQAKLAHRWLADKIKAGDNVALIGDVNTDYPFEDSKVAADISTLRGWHTPEADDDLFDCHELLAPADRATHIINKQFDRILLSDSLRRGDAKRKNLILKSVTNRKDLSIRGAMQDADHLDYYRIPQAERDVSDHFPVVAEFQWQ